MRGFVVAVVLVWLVLDWWWLLLLFGTGDLFHLLSLSLVCFANLLVSLVGWLVFVVYASALDLFFVVLPSLFVLLWWYYAYWMRST